MKSCWKRSTAGRTSSRRTACGALPRAPESFGRAVGFILNDWQLAGVLTAGSGPAYDLNFSYQNNGANVNLTGSQNYGARIPYVGDPGSGCSDNQYAQFNVGLGHRTAARQRRPGVRAEPPAWLRRTSGSICRSRETFAWVALAAWSSGWTCSTRSTR